MRKLKQEMLAVLVIGSLCGCGKTTKSERAHSPERQDNVEESKPVAPGDKGLVAMNAELSVLSQRQDKLSSGLKKLEQSRAELVTTSGADLSEINAGIEKIEKEIARVVDYTDAAASTAKADLDAAILVQKRTLADYQAAKAEYETARKGYDNGLSIIKQGVASGLLAASWVTAYEEKNLPALEDKKARLSTSEKLAADAIGARSKADQELRRAQFNNAKLKDAMSRKTVLEGQRDQLTALDAEITSDQEMLKTLTSEIGVLQRLIEELQ